MTSPMREVLALIHIIEAESDVEERGLLVEAARTAVRRLRHSRLDATNAMALLDALLNAPVGPPAASGRTVRSVASARAYA